MAHFYATAQGRGKKQVTQLGTKESGCRASVNGWDFGVSCHMAHIGDSDMCEIWVTSGSNGGKTVKLGTYYKKQDKFYNEEQEVK